MSNLRQELQTWELFSENSAGAAVSVRRGYTPDRPWAMSIRARFSSTEPPDGNGGPTSPHALVCHQYRAHEGGTRNEFPIRHSTIQQTPGRDPSHPSGASPVPLNQASNTLAHGLLCFDHLSTLTSWKRNSSLIRWVTSGVRSSKMTLISGSFALELTPFRERILTSAQMHKLLLHMYSLDLRS